MGGNKSKQTKPTKAFVPRYRPQPVQTYPVNDPKPKPEYTLPKEVVKNIPPILPRYSPRRDRLYNPNSKRPVELSWLHQNGRNDNYTRINYHYHNHHHHPHPHYHGPQHLHHGLHQHDHDTPIPLAINRWPIKTNNYARSRLLFKPVFRSKSFIDEYVYQKSTIR